jgi:hypothetical protein
MTRLFVYFGNLHTFIKHNLLKNFTYKQNDLSLAFKFFFRDSSQQQLSHSGRRNPYCT